ncbi:MAG: DUF3634 family protein [Planctomyces sp.]|nr:DUF3634 family protein [Planctomyces sp.]
MLRRLPSGSDRDYAGRGQAHMDNSLGTAIVVMVVLGLITWFGVSWRSRSDVFRVRIRDGRPEATFGRVTQAFLEVVQTLCAEHAVQHGDIRGRAQGRTIQLRFSRDFPPGCAQQLRNWWALDGWPAPARSARRC